MEKNRELFEVTSMFRMFIKGISDEWKKHGFSVNIAQYKVLYTIEMNGSLNVSQIANELVISSAAVTGITDQLSQLGYVSKERCHNDRRIVKIAITQKGSALVKEILENQNATLHRFFDVLPDEEIQHLKRIFTKLNENLFTQN